MELINLIQDFISTCKTYGKIIISERYIQTSKKTIQPSIMGGAAGGEKYIVNNGLFSFFPSLLIFIFFIFFSHFSFHNMYINICNIHIYVHIIVLFKFAVDTNNLFRGDDYAAAKVAGHELKGLMAYRSERGEGKGKREGKGREG